MNKRLVPAYASRPKKNVGGSLASQELDVGEGITAWIAETRRGIVLGDVARRPKARHATGYPDREDSIVAAPLIFEDKLLGVITVLKQGLNRYGSDHLRLLKILANQAAVAIAGARLNERLAAAHRM